MHHARVNSCRSVRVFIQSCIAYAATWLVFGGRIDVMFWLGMLSCAVVIGLFEWMRALRQGATSEVPNGDDSVTGASRNAADGGRSSADGRHFKLWVWLAMLGVAGGASFGCTVDSVGDLDLDGRWALVCAVKSDGDCISASELGFDVVWTIDVSGQTITREWTPRGVRLPRSVRLDPVRTVTAFEVTSDGNWVLGGESVPRSGDAAEISVTRRARTLEIRVVRYQDVVAGHTLASQQEQPEEELRVLQFQKED